MNLLLIGLRGAGKSTIGPALSARIGMPFVDLDGESARVLGCATIAEAWRTHGQEAFRRAETTALREALRRNRRVLALGGGTPTAPGATEAIEKARGTGTARVVYLRCTPAELRARLSASGPGAERPSITGADPLDEIAQVFAQRDPLYSQLADRVVEGGLDAERIVEALASWWAGGATRPSRSDR